MGFPSMQRQKERNKFDHPHAQQLLYTNYIHDIKQFWNKEYDVVTSYFPVQMNKILQHLLLRVGADVLRLENPAGKTVQTW